MAESAPQVATTSSPRPTRALRPAPAPQMAESAPQVATTSSPRRPLGRLPACTGRCRNPTRHRHPRMCKSRLVHHPGLSRHPPAVRGRAPKTATQPSCLPCMAPRRPSRRLRNLCLRSCPGRQVWRQHRLPPGSLGPVARERRPRPPRMEPPLPMPFLSALGTLWARPRAAPHPARAPHRPREPAHPRLLHCHPPPPPHRGVTSPVERQHAARLGLRAARPCRRRARLEHACLLSLAVLGLPLRWPSSHHPASSWQPRQSFSATAGPPGTPGSPGILASAVQPPGPMRRIGCRHLPTSVISCTPAAAPQHPRRCPTAAAAVRAAHERRQGGCQPPGGRRVVSAPCLRRLQGLPRRRPRRCHHPCTAGRLGRPWKQGPWLGGAAEAAGA